MWFGICGTGVAVQGCLAATVWLRRRVIGDRGQARNSADAARSPIKTCRNASWTVAGMYPSGIGKGKQGKDGNTKAKISCGFCGKPNHDASACWNNPQSASYRPRFAQKTGLMEHQRFLQR